MGSAAARRAASHAEAGPPPPGPLPPQAGEGEGEGENCNGTCVIGVVGEGSVRFGWLRGGPHPGEHHSPTLSQLRERVRVW
jgi:hypothetical protein